MLRPEWRKRHALAPDPLPVLGAPPARIAVTAVLDELEECLVGRVMALAGKGRDLLLVRGPLVVPGEKVRVRGDAEYSASTRNFDLLLRWRRAAGHGHVALGLPLALQR